jgi:hypothetical protein
MWEDDLNNYSRVLWLIGDEAILWVVIDEFKKTFGDVDFTVLSSNPWRTKKDSWRESNEEAHHISQLPETFFSLDLTCLSSLVRFMLPSFLGYAVVADKIYSGFSCLGCYNNR